MTFWLLNFFRQFLLNEDFFLNPRTKINAGASEGGAAVFELDYKGQPACLAQSPQLHKQMVINGGFGGNFSGVFVVGPAFRAEDLYTHRHLCEFTSLDVEMEIKRHYFEVMDLVDRLFVLCFYWSRPQSPRYEPSLPPGQIPFVGSNKLKSPSFLMVDPLGDLNTEIERALRPFPFMTPSWAFPQRHISFLSPPYSTLPPITLP
ncbi:aspartate--tRNA ligase 1, cytoplasmic-like [Rutidosis leptorrhynchoides]|uniref:aspartate--tRNA ligase 1, cytoplasmic-like n=1 Tax=Rutidosis leptorrhynchoides TaxID=125765 RepID=UPI003A9962B9